MKQSKLCHWAYQLIAILLFVGLGVVVAVGVVAAQASDNTPVPQASDNTPVPQAEGNATGVSADEVNAVASELWCPLCSGVRLDACELKACEQMREVIEIKLSEGENTDSIRDYFVAQYGPQVLGEPPLEGFNWLAWLLPFVALAAGGYFLWNTIRGMVRPTPVAVTQAPTTPTLSDEEQRKLAEELKRL